MLSVITWVADKLVSWRQQRRNVTVRVHGPAVFLGMAESIPVTGSASPPRMPTFYFVKVTNEGLRDVVVTHVWVDGQPRVDVLDPQRPLPTRLRPDQQWEAPIPLAAVAHIPEPQYAVRVRLSNRQVLSSMPDWDVPREGPMAGRGSPE
jgi:hypothetical protein